MIFNTRQIQLMRMGLPPIPANGGDGGESSSSSDQTSTVTNTDKRITTESGVIATEGATVNVQSLDKDLITKALETVQVTDATNKDGFTGLLNLADRFLTATRETGKVTTDAATTLAARYQSDVMDAYSKAQADKAGSIDQKTMMVMAVVAGTAYIASRRSKA